MDTLVVLLQEIDGLIKERDELRRQVEALQHKAGVINRRKLSDREVKEIRNLARTSGLSQRDIADVYDVNPATVSRIVRNIYHT